VAADKPAGMSIRQKQIAGRELEDPVVIAPALENPRPADALKSAVAFYRPAYGCLLEGAGGDV